jgi:hypothetical protein
LKLNNSGSSPNNVLRSLVIENWDWFELSSLLHQLPNLHRLETNFEESCTSIVNCIPPHLSMSHLKITLKDPLHDLKKLLQSTPNIARLRIRGSLGSNDVIDHFEKVAEFLPILAPRLQHFDCELYCALYNSHGEEVIIQQLHPLFNRVRCLFGRGRNQCYATDIMFYPINNEYQGEDIILTLFSELQNKLISLYI